MSINNGLLTIAFGKKYTKFAKYLAYSCIIHSPNTLRSVITDCPNELSQYYDVVIPFPANFDPFSLKTQLYHYTPFHKTIFIDTDSMIFNSLDSIWEISKNNSFSYYGILRTEGFWYFNIKDMLIKLDLNWIPEFNSGMFIFDNSEESKSIFDYAYNSLINYKDNEISYFRKEMLPDEPFLSISLSKHGIKPVNDNSRFSRTLIGSKNLNINVVKGFAYYFKDNKLVFPYIIHFCGHFGKIAYFFQRIKILIYLKFSISNIILNILAFFRNIMYK